MFFPVFLCIHCQFKCTQSKFYIIVITCCSTNHYCSTFPPQNELESDTRLISKTTEWKLEKNEKHGMGIFARLTPPFPLMKQLPESALKILRLSFWSISSFLPFFLSLKSMLLNCFRATKVRFLTWNINFLFLCRSQRNEICFSYFCYFCCVTSQLFLYVSSHFIFVASYMSYFLNVDLFFLCFHFSYFLLMDFLNSKKNNVITQNNHPFKIVHALSPAFAHFT